MTLPTLGAIGRRADTFWFAPTDPATLGVVRIAFGAIATLWALSIAPDLGAFFSTAGVIGDATGDRGGWAWSVLWVNHSDLAVAVVYLALLTAAFALTAGWHTRLSAVVVFAAMTSLQRADPYVFNSGDTLLRLLAFYLTLAPAGAEFSLDMRRARRSGRLLAASHRAWPLRLIQLQLCAMYASAVWSKLHGATWRDGTAASYALRLPDLARFDVPDALSASRLGAHIATYGTLLVESTLVVLVWNRRTRLPALCAGVVMHLFIDASLRVGFFTLAVFAAYLSFADPGWVRALVESATRLWTASEPCASRRPSGDRAGPVGDARAGGCATWDEPTTV